MWLLFVLAGSVMPALSGTFPTDVPSGAAIVGWERFGGSATGPTGDRISYELLVDPKRPALYAITRYRIHAGRTSGPENEMMIWFARVRDTRCYHRVRVEGDRVAWEWRVVPSGTRVFNDAMSHARAVYELNRRREAAEEQRLERAGRD